MERVELPIQASPAPLSTLPVTNWMGEFEKTSGWLSDEFRRATKKNKKPAKAASAKRHRKGLQANLLVQTLAQCRHGPKER